MVLLWLWHRSAAIAPIKPLAWEASCATGVAPPKKIATSPRHSETPSHWPVFSPLLVYEFMNLFITARI